MARPSRPNPYKGPRTRTSGDTEQERARRPWRVTHVRQETRVERKVRLRVEAEVRQARSDARKAAA